MEFTDQIRGFKIIGDSEYRMSYNVGLADMFSELDHAASILIPAFEESLGVRAFAIYFQENQRNHGKLFSVRIEVDLKSSDEED